MNAPVSFSLRRGMEAQFRLRAERIAAGDKPFGWKVGFGAAAAMEKLRITAPLVGFLMQSGVVQNGGTVSLAGWTKPVAEPEIAIYLGADVAAGADEPTIRKAIAAIGPVFELADMVEPPENAERIVAGNIFQRQLVLGPRDVTRAGARVNGLHARVLRGETEFAETADVEVNTGKLVSLVRLVADTLAPFGERVRAGEVIIPGSVVPPIFIEPSDKFVSFRLDPIGEVSLRFGAS